MQKKVKIAILISGRGSNMVALIEALGDHPRADFCCVISDNAHAQGLAKAIKLGLATHIIERTKYANRGDFEKDLKLHLQDYQPLLIVLAGFMQILSPSFIHYFPRIINIHPSLLPKYKGLNTHQRALDNNEKYIGATVHWVNEVMDGGNIIAQSQIEVEEDDTANTLAERLLGVEHQLYQQVIKDLLEQKGLLPYNV